MRRSALDPILSAQLADRARELFRQGIPLEDIEEELIVRGATAKEARDIAGVAQTTETVLRLSASEQQPEWLEHGREWLNLFGFLFIVGGAGVLVLGAMGAVRGVREPLASALLLGGAAAGLVFGICLMLRQVWAGWTAFVLALLAAVIAVGHGVYVMAADPSQAFEVGRLSVGVVKLLAAILVVLLGVKARRWL
jgi:hypothetical protein